MASHGHEVARSSPLWMAASIVVAIVAVNYVLGNITSINQLIVTIISAAIGLSLVMAVFYLLYKRWESNI